MRRRKRRSVTHGMQGLRDKFKRLRSEKVRYKAPSRWVKYKKLGYGWWEQVRGPFLGINQGTHKRISRIYFRVYDEKGFGNYYHTWSYGSSQRGIFFYSLATYDMYTSGFSRYLRSGCRIITGVRRTSKRFVARRIWTAEQRSDPNAWDLKYVLYTKYLNPEERAYWKEHFYRPGRDD